MDPVYGFQAVNVEAQLRTPNSLLRWMQRFIALRKEHPVFGLGTYEPLPAENTRIFAHIRTWEDDVVLCVHNLARSAQAVQLDLSDYAGMVPVEMLGRTALPADRGAAVSPDARAAWVLLVPAQAGGAGGVSMDERALIEYVTRQRWYGAKSRTVSHSEVLDTVARPAGRAAAVARPRRDALRHGSARRLPAARLGRRRGRPLDGLAEDAGIAREIVSAMRTG